MTDRQREYDIEDATEDAVDLYEIPLIDLTDEEPSDSSGPVDINNKGANSASTRTQGLSRSLHNSRTRDSSTRGTDIQLKSCRLPNGDTIRAGDTVELKLPGFRNQGLQSGDFLKVSKIVKDAANEQISLHGHKLVREKYLHGKGSDGITGKLNELMMHLVVREDDHRPALVQGLESVRLDEVKIKRAIILTTKPYPMKSFRNGPLPYSRALSKDDVKRDIFHQGTLVCRWSLTTIISPNGSAYGGIMRLLSETETATATPNCQRVLNRQSYIPVAQEQATASAQLLREARLGKRPARTPSLEVLDTPPSKRGRANPIKSEKYTYVDICCGAGGSSRGAAQAHLHVIAGLDFDDLAMEAWEKNNPGGLPFSMNAFDFLKLDLFKVVGRIHVLSISNPCQVFSSAHTIAGRDDEENVRALDFISKMLEGLKPRILVLENTANLVNMTKNRAHFHRLLRNITTAQPGYSVSYKVVNMVDYGLPQPRKRLIIIAARRGVPLPPFPKPTHGPDGSGLLPYVSIGDALEGLERLGRRTSNDPYHQPRNMAVSNGQAYNPYTKFINCIMTSGVTSMHPNGKRNFTTRELATLQSLPLHHYLTGSDAKAVKQIGNMFPPVMAEIVYRTCAQTLEAFDNGFITAEDEIEDLDITLIEKGVVIPEKPVRTSSISRKDLSYPYRYLRPPQLSDATHASHSSAWQERKLTRRTKPQGRSKHVPMNMFGDEESDFDSPSPQPVRDVKRPMPRKTRQEKNFWDKFNGKVIDLSIESEEDDSDSLFM